MDIYNSILFLLLLGVAVFGAAVLAMIVLFGLSLKDISKNVSGLAMVLLLAIGIPVGVGLVKNKTSMNSNAAALVKVVNLEVAKVSKGVNIVNLTLSMPAVAYLEYQDNSRDYSVPILPTSTLEPKTDFSYLISNISTAGGQAVLIVNNEQVLIKDKKINITY